MANFKTLAPMLLLLGCSGSGEDDESFTCAQTDRQGTYLVQLTELSGDCGPIPEQLGRLDDPTALPNTCSLDAPDRWSNGDCKLERSYSCEEPGIGAGVTSQTIAVTDQADDSGSHITGTVTLRVLDVDGTQLCRSTYDFDAIRQ